MRRSFYVFPSHLALELVLPAIFLSLVAVTYFVEVSGVCGAPDLTHPALYPEDQSTLCTVMLSSAATSLSLYFWCHICNSFFFLFTSSFYFCAESSTNKKSGVTKWKTGVERGEKKKATLNVFLTLIGTHTEAVKAINKTIQLERWVWVLPTTVRSAWSACESWSRKWIVISCYGHKRLPYRFGLGL